MKIETPTASRASVGRRVDRTVLMAGPLRACVVVCGALTGCWGGGGGQSESIPPTAFVAPPAQQPGVDQRRAAAADNPGELRYDNPRADAPRNEALERGAEATNAAAPTPGGETVRRQVSSPAALATQRAGGEPSSTMPATAPSTRTSQIRPSQSSAQYMTIGAVICEVNGKPIYADKIINDLKPVLSAKARELEFDRYKALSLDEIKKQVQLAIRDEIEFAAAQRNLEPKDKEFADQLTMQWRQQQITLAGGSEELTRQKARAEGREFDDYVQDRYRLEMRRIYFQRKEFPRIQITADDLRQYYEKNKASLFSEREQAQFRVIKIETKQMGSPDKARAKAQELRDRAANGEDFAEIAGSINHNPLWLKSKGDVGMVDRGAFALEKIEQAVWTKNSGDLTDVVQIGDAFYVAKIEQKKAGRTEPFESQKVQDTIRRRIESEQFNALRDKVFTKLYKDSIVYPDPPVFAPALEMAMQYYPMWAGKK